MRVLVFIILLVGSVVTASSTIGQTTTDDYDRQLREYDQRVADAQELENERQSQDWGYLIVIAGILIVFLVLSHYGTRRRVKPLIEQSKQQFDQSLQQIEKSLEQSKQQFEQSLQQIEKSLEQGQEIIELLKSIDERIGKGN